MFRPSALAICLFTAGVASVFGGCSSDKDPSATNDPPNDPPKGDPAGGGSNDGQLGAPPNAPPDGTPDDVELEDGGRSSDARASAPPPPRDAGGPVVTDAGSGAKDAGPSPGPDPAAQVCARWRSDRQERAEGAWSGNVAACNAGDTASPGRANALKLVNLYRWMAALSPVTDDAAKNAKSQQCALMMDANKSLNHSPPTTWKCYSQDGADGAGRSNIATTPGVKAVDLYMSDPGNETTLGHRRWILSKSLGPIGLGSTSNYSCMNVIGGSGNEARPYVAWPPGGPFPSGALKASFSYQLDKTGWSIQSDTIDLSKGTVTITDGGTNMPVTVNVLGANYGSRYAIRMVPNGWTSQKGHTYSVSVSGISQPINYQVQITDCD
ncbi:CAP domain-containing protein [Pendulispora albinea]|uniref:CAP domain-containing protein n=1 Tax=Pendulispora albinea TaxID=2741071 RepID=A0ABZ2LRE4_9BACT